MSRKSVRFGGLAAVATLLFVLAGCGSEPVETPSGPQAVILDVRTPAEYSEGHLKGAVNIDFQSGVFEQQLGDLEPGGVYVVYCRSGNRSAQAAQLMKDAGFADVTDLGSMEAAAAATGLQVVVN